MSALKHTAILLIYFTIIWYEISLTQESSYVNATMTIYMAFSAVDGVSAGKSFVIQLVEYVNKIGSVSSNIKWKPEFRLKWKRNHNKC